MKKEKNPILEELHKIREKLSRQYRNNHTQFILEAQQIAQELGLKRITKVPAKKKKK